MKNAYQYTERLRTRDFSEHIIWDLLEMVALGAASVGFGYLLHVLLF